MSEQSRVSNEYSIVEDDGYLRVNVTTALTWEGMVEAYREVERLSRENPRPRLWVFPEDVSPLILDDFSMERMRMLTDLGMGTSAPGRAAIVAANPVFFGKTRQQFATHPETADQFQVFRSEAEALDWLRA